jgi:hypothetical protein
MTNPILSHGSNMSQVYQDLLKVVGIKINKMPGTMAQPVVPAT